MSLLLANGHAKAHLYPIGKVTVEAEIVVERIDREEANRAILIQMAVSSLLSKKAADIFSKQVKKMTQT